MEALVRRQDPKAASGPSLGAGEAVDLATAIDMYTRNAAWVMKLDRVSGRVEVGKRADLVVLDRNLFEIPVTEINETRVLLTLMDGRVDRDPNRRESRRSVAGPIAPSNFVGPLVWRSIRALTSRQRSDVGASTLRAIFTGWSPSRKRMDAA